MINKQYFITKDQINHINLKIWPLKYFHLKMGYLWILLFKNPPLVILIIYLWKFCMKMGEGSSIVELLIFPTGPIGKMLFKFVLLYIYPKNIFEYRYLKFCFLHPIFLKFIYIITLKLYYQLYVLEKLR